MSGAWLVLPTYNEAENLESMIAAVLPRLAESGVEHHVLVVDDGSPDGTGRIADRLASEHPEVEVLHRAAKAGLGPAYLEGFGHALAAGAEYLLEMDADFSHDPGELPRLIQGAADADLVIGSRYVAGGGVENWGLVRRALSRGGCLYARALLRVPVRDLTGGFKCFRREVLSTLDLSRVAADGYGFQIEMTYRTLKAGFRVREVPIVFHERRAGQSKMSATIALEALWKVPALRLKGRGDRRPQCRSEGSRQGWRRSLSSDARQHNPRGEPPMVGSVPDVTDSNFQAQVIEADGPVLVDFWAPWCGPCRVVGPVLEEINDERDDLQVVKLNVDDNPQTAQSYGVMSIPTMIVFKHGQEAHKVVGAMPKGRLEQELEPILA